MSVSLYKIKKWYKMLTGKSISHVNQGIGTCYSKTEVAGYYNDLTEKVTKDDPNIFVPQYYVDTGEEIYFSIGIFQYGLAAYDLYITTHEDKYKDKLTACANWALENQQDDGGWVTFTYDSPDHPYSSMAQGEGISMLIRAHIATKEESYLRAAKKAKDFMLKSVEDGGTTVYDGEDVYLCEYTYEPVVLNGWIFSYWGLRDFTLFFKDDTVEKKANATLKTIIKKLPEYDLKYWSKYDIKKRITSPFYHNLHISQLRVMYDLTGEIAFKEYADKWEKNASNVFCKSRAFIKKSMQKIFERQ